MYIIYLLVLLSSGNRKIIVNLSTVILAPLPLLLPAFNLSVVFFMNFPSASLTCGAANYLHVLSGLTQTFFAAKFMSLALAVRGVKFLKYKL